MQVGPTSQTEGLVPEINLDALQHEWIVAQLDLETAQTQIHFVELIAQTHRAVLAHDPVDLHEEEPVQILVRIQQPQMMSAPGKATLRTHAGGGVLAQMIELLQPAAEPLIELLQSLDGLSGQLQLAFKILLNGSKESFNLSLAPGVVGPGGFGFPGYVCRANGRASSTRAAWDLFVSIAGRAPAREQRAPSGPVPEPRLPAGE